MMWCFWCRGTIKLRWFRLTPEEREYNIWS